MTMSDSTIPVVEDGCDVRRFLIEAIAEITSTDAAGLTDRTPLVGEGSPLDSRDLVELLLCAEDFARARLLARFDWTSSDSIKRQREILRSVGSLAEHLRSLPSAHGGHGT
jgi:hypothetical protein